MLSLTVGGAYAQKKSKGRTAAAKVLTWKQLENNADYVYGTGRAPKDKDADKLAMEDLAVSMNSMLYSRYAYLDSMTVFGETQNVDTRVGERIKTYLGSKLYAPVKINIVNAKDKQKNVARYIAKADIQKLLDERTDKVNAYVGQALKDEKDGKYADALSNYHLALSLLSCCPDGDKYELDYLETGKGLACNIIPSQMNALLARMSMTIESVEKSGDEKVATVKVSLDGVKADGIRFTCSDGENINSDILTSKGGEAKLRLPGDTKEKKLKLTATIDYRPVNHKASDAGVTQALAIANVPLLSSATLNVSIDLKKSKKK